MSRFASFCGVVGIIFLLFAGIAYFITRDFSGYVFVNAIFGALAVITFLSSAKGSLSTFFGERSTKYGVSAVFYALLFFAILFFVNFLSNRHHHRFDLTESGLYSLSPQTVDLLHRLDKPLEIHAFVEAGSDPQLRELLDSYHYASDKVSFSIINPDKQPDLAEKYQITTVPAIHLQYGERSNVVNKLTEEELTNGLIRITKG